MVATVMEKIIRQNMKKNEDVTFSVGDTVKVYAKIKEGDKERIQVFAGMVIARKGGGNSESFTVRRVSHGVGVERIFPVHSPFVAKIEVESSANVRRSKLYYTRNLSSKKTRLHTKLEGEKDVVAAPAKKG